MSAALDRDVARERLIAYLAGSFAFLALLLACVGLYGVLSYTVARRTQEIGVRMALGARPGDLTRMVIGDGSRVVLAGVALGLAAALADRPARHHAARRRQRVGSDHARSPSVSRSSASRSRRPTPARRAAGEPHRALRTE